MMNTMDGLVVGPHPPAQLGMVNSRFTVFATDGRVIDASVEYEVDGRRWTHAFTAERLSFDALDRALARAGIHHITLSARRKDWIAARHSPRS